MLEIIVLLIGTGLIGIGIVELDHHKTREEVAAQQEKGPFHLGPVDIRPAEGGELKSDKIKALEKYDGPEMH